MNCPGRQLEDHADLKMELKRKFETGTCSDLCSQSVIDNFAGIQQEFWESVQYGL
jgi:hypothetical protein